jgi:methylase of polypeptide subunit release factors
LARSYVRVSLTPREATELLMQYFTPRASFDPPCSALLTPSPKRIIELGSGQSVASLHLAKSLAPSDTLILTDLPNVMPLCEQSARKAALPVKVSPQPLAWGSSSDHLDPYRPFTHIIMCDLVSCASNRTDARFTFPSCTPPSSTLC